MERIKSTFGQVFPILRAENQPSARTRVASAMHLEPGVVRYEGMGEGGGDLMLLLPKETIDKMRPKFRGTHVINGAHKDLGHNTEVLSKGLADGMVLDSYWDAEKGQEWVNYLVWTQEAVNALESEEMGVSCSYTVTNRDMTPGTWHNVPYDGVILDGEYNHLAIVPNPRYEASRNTLMNAKGGDGMFKLLLKKLGIENSVEVDGSKSFIEHEGKKISVKDAVEKYMAAENAVPEVLPDDALITLPNGKKVDVASIKKMLANGAPGVNEPPSNQPQTGPMNAAPGVNEPPSNQPSTGPMNAMSEEEKKKKEEEAKNAKDKEEEEKKKKDAENARLENEKKAAADKARALEEAALNRLDNQDFERPYITETDALARGREMFGSDLRQ